MFTAEVTSNSRLLCSYNDPEMIVDTQYMKQKRMQW